MKTQTFDIVRYTHAKTPSNTPLALAPFMPFVLPLSTIQFSLERSHFAHIFPLNQDKTRRLATISSSILGYIK